MRVALLIALGAPAAGAFSAAGADLRSRRAVAAASLGAALVAAAVAFARSSGAGEAPLAGFVADRWRLVLVLGTLLGAAPALRGALREERTPALDVALLAGAGATAASLLAGNVVAFGLLLAGSSVAFAVAAEACGGMRARRAAAALLSSDALALLGLVLAASHGLTTPPDPTVGASVLLLAAAAIRLGLVPAAGALDDAAAAHPSLAATALGGVRAQGVLLLVWSLGGPGGISRAILGLGAVSALWGGYRAAREGSVPAAATAHGGLIAMALALGGHASLWGAVLLAGAGFVIWPLLLSGGDLGRAGAGLWALSAAMPGAALAGAAASQAAAGRPAYLPIAVAVAASAVALVASAPRLQPPDWGARNGPTEATAAWWWVAPAVGLALAAAILPARALERVAVPAGEALGAPRLLHPPEGLLEPGRLGFWIVVLLLVGLATRPVGARSAPGGSRPAPLPWSAWWGSAPRLPSARSGVGRARLYWGAQRWLATSAAIAAVVGVLALVLYAAGVRRGFL